MAAGFKTCLTGPPNLATLKRTNPSNITNDRIRSLNVEIKTYYLAKTPKKVRQNILSGKSGSLWKAVKIATDIP